MTVAFLNRNTAQQITAGSVNDTTNMSVTAGGTNKLAVIFIAYDNLASASVSAVTYGGQTCTKAGSTAFNATSNAYTEWWYLVNPPTGLNALVITGVNVSEFYYNLVSYTGVNQVTPVRAGSYTTATGTSTAPAITIPSNTVDLTCSCVNSGGSSITATNQTSDGINTNGGFSGASDHCTTAASSVTHTWTEGSASWAIAGFSINGDPTTPAGLVISSRSLGPGRHVGSVFNQVVRSPQAYVVPDSLKTLVVPTRPLVRLGRFTFILEHRQNQGTFNPVVVSVLPPTRTLMGVGI